MILGASGRPEGRIFRCCYRRSLKLGVAFLATVIFPAYAADAGAQDAVSPKLEPSKDVAEILSTLEAGQSTWLPPAEILGDFNEEARRHRLHETGPRGRDFCIKAIWAPERQRALFAGANHGAPHRLNDVWEYDLAANTWYLLYAPDPNVLRGNVDEYEAAREVRQHTLGSEEDGSREEVTLVHTQRGGPAELSHTYWGFAYDPVRRAAMWHVVRANDGGSYDGLPIWEFYPQKREWRPVLAPKPRPLKSGILASEYIPELEGMIWYGATWRRPGMWVLPSDGSQFVNLRPNNDVNPYHCANCPGGNAVMTYDEAERLLIAVDERRTYHYDVEKNEWSLAAEGESDEAPFGHYARTVFGYDAASGVALLYARAQPDTVWAYDSAAKSWTRHQVSGPEGPTEKIIGYVDPARNVLVVNDRREVWVYRHGSDQRAEGPES